MSRARKVMVAGCLAAALVVPIGVRDARACGGFFCSQPPPDGSLPIAQAAENVLFVMDKDPATGAPRVEAHVQILYTGPATQFSWIVPVTAVPTVDVGWDILFDRIEPPTRPSFRPQYQVEGACKMSSDGIGCGSVGAADSAGGTGTGGAGGTPQDPGVDILSRGSVGPYDYVIVRSEDGATLRTWLATNGYFVSDDAARIVDEYVAGGHSFVAVKLQVGQDTSAIRPIILRLQSPEACLPLKLTAIASTPDLRINVWVLADARAIPINYVEIEVNQAKIDWFRFGANYDQLMKEAANEAQGNAFAVEYAQPATASASWFALASPELRAALANQPNPPSYLSALASIGVSPSGAVRQVLRKYIPLPASLAAQGVTEAAYYSGISFYWSQGGAAPFDPVALTAALETDVLKPIDHFGSVFASHGYVTRLATFISPEEMTKDPLFLTNRLLPDVPAQRTALARVLCGDEEFFYCDAPVQLELPDGRKVRYADGACSFGMTTPARPDIDAMPSADVAWNRDPDSEGQMVLDNRAAITQALMAHNATIAGPDSGCGCALRARPRGLAVIALAAGALALLVRGRRRRR